MMVVKRPLFFSLNGERRPFFIIKTNFAIPL